MINLPLFTHLNVILYDFIASLEHKKGILLNIIAAFFQWKCFGGPKKSSPYDLYILSLLKPINDEQIEMYIIMYWKYSPSSKLSNIFFVFAYVHSIMLDIIDERLQDAEETNHVWCHWCQTWLEISAQVIWKTLCFFVSIHFHCTVSKRAAQTLSK